MADDLPEEPDVVRPLPPVSVRDLLERLRSGWITAGVLVLGLAVAGYVLLRPPAAPATELTLPMAGSGSTVPASTTTTAAASIVVHAAGAVAAPGIHSLPAGSRVADLLVAAGGPAADADLDRVNLAALLSDGERVWFPRVGEAAEPVVVGASPGEVEPTGPLDLNAATAEQLDGLPGIGPAIAAAIVSYREEHGPFTAVEGLLEVPGIGDARLAQLRDLVTV